MNFPRSLEKRSQKASFRLAWCQWPC